MNTEYDVDQPKKSPKVSDKQTPNHHEKQPSLSRKSKPRMVIPKILHLPGIQS